VTRSDITVTRRAVDRAITLGELRSLITELDDLGAAESTTLTARGAWSGSKVITATVVRLGDPERTR